MKTVLITGATSGIGLALARHFVEDGDFVIACGRNKAALDELARRHGDRLHPLLFDITDRVAVLSALAPIAHIDIAILNAGTCEYVDVDRFDSVLFQRVMATNFMGLVHCVEALLPKLKAGQALVVMDSLARLLPFTRSQAYGASKAAAHYFAKSLAVDLQPRGIRVLSISPGFVDTPLTHNNSFAMPMRISADEAAHRIAAGIRAGRSNIYFPTPFAAMLRLLHLLPESLQAWLCRRMKGAQ